MMCTQFNPIYFSNENDDCMNEYRGFKVGDKVEVLNENKTTITTGTIERFGDRKLGGCAEPDTMQVVINCSTHHSLFDIIYLVSHELIEKLPKYAVGDAVRYNGKIATIDELGDMPSFFIASIYGEGRIWALTSELEPFDGFRIGDTVWSAKRGKGEIVAYNKSFDGASTKRVFVVKFDNENSGLFDVSRRPKHSNLFPTERKMIESLPQKIAYTISFPGTMSDEVAKMLGYKMVSTAGQATADNVRPPIQIGDFVYYDHLCSDDKKWKVSGFKFGSDFNKPEYNIFQGTKSVSSVKLSDLRLWQETKLTHCLQRDTDNWYEFDITTYRNLKYLGRICGHETFTAEDGGGNLCLYRGIKGDDIQ